MKFKKFPKKVFYFLLLMFVSINLAAQNNQDSIAYYSTKIKEAEIHPPDSVSYFYDQLIELVPLKTKSNLFRKKALYLIENNLNLAAEREFSKALAIAKKNNFKDVESRVYHDLGYHHYILNDNAKAYNYFLLSQDLYEELQDFENLNIIKTNIGSFYTEEGNFTKAAQLFNESLNYYQEQKDSVGMLYTKISIGDLYRESGEYQKSKDLFMELSSYPKLTQSEESLVYYNLAINESVYGKNKLATVYIDKAIDISSQINDKIQLIDLHYLKGEFEVSNGNYTSALTYLNKSLKTSQEIDDYVFQEELLKLILDVNIKAKKYSNVDSVFMNLNAVRDTLDNRERVNSYKEVFLENQLMLKEKSIINKQHELEHEQRNAIIYLALIIVGVFSFVLLSYVFYFYRKNTSKNTRLLKQKALINVIELKNERKVEAYETKSIQDDLNARKRELLLALTFTQKRKERVKRITNKIDKLSSNSIITKEHLSDLKSFIIKQSVELDSEEDIQQKIVSTHKDFFNKLTLDFPKLTQTELKVLAYLRLNMNTKEISSIQNVSIDAIRKMRYRIRKKLELTPKQSLEKFILRYH